MRQHPRYVVVTAQGAIFGPFWTASAAAKWAHANIGNWSIRPILPA